MKYFELAIAGCGGILGFWLFFLRPRLRSTALVNGNDVFDKCRVKFIGSATWKTGPSFAGRASFPMVQLQIFDQGLRVSGNFRWIRWAVPTIELLWSDIAIVKKSPTGIRIVRRDVENAFIVFQMNSRAVLSSLSAYPVRIDDS